MSESSQSMQLRPNGTPRPADTKALWAGAGGSGMNIEVAKALGVVGEHYELDPALGEVVILGNKVYVTYEGYLRVADQHPDYDGFEAWPLNEAERKSMKVGEDEFAFGCRVWRKNRRFPAVAYGVASDRSVQAGPLKVYLREIAWKRAHHRALRFAFRVGLPDAPAAMEQYEQTGTVALPIIEQGEYQEREPAALPQPDWKSFWTHCKGLGVEHDEVHRVLNVQSMTDWQGTLEEAIGLVEQYVLARDQRKEPVAVPAPTAGQAPKFDRARAEKRYIALSDKADVLGVTTEPFKSTWNDDELRARGRELSNAIIRAETEMEQKPEGQS